MLSCWDPDELKFVETMRLMGAGKFPYPVSWNRGEDTWLFCCFVALSHLHSSLGTCEGPTRAIHSQSTSQLLSFLTSDPESWSPIYLPLPKFKTALYAYPR